MIESKDVVGSILGASAALAGFVLVFLGIIIAAYQSYSGGGVPEQVVKPFREMAAVLLGAFGMCLVTVIVSLIWLVGGGPDAAYPIVVGLFVVLLVLVFTAAAWTTWLVLRE